MTIPGRWMTLRKPKGKHLTCAARKLKSYRAYNHFYWHRCDNCGYLEEDVYCVKWSQDDSFYCCPRDYQNDPASGWRNNHEAIELFELFSNLQVDN